MSIQQLRRSSVMDLPLRQLNHHLDPSDDQAMIDHKDNDNDDSSSSDDGSVDFPSVRPPSSSSEPQQQPRDAAAAVLIYHESARDIVFRDHLRRASNNTTSGKSNNSNNKQTAGGGACCDDSRDMQSLYMSIRSLERRNSFDQGSTRNIQTSSLERRNSFDEQQHQQEHSSSMSLPIRDLRASFRATASFDANSIRESILLDDSLGSTNAANAPHTVGYIAAIRPLSPMILTQENHFHPLLKEQSSSSSSPLEMTTSWTVAERQVVDMMQNQRACVKTIKNNEWTAFLERFKTAQVSPHGRCSNKLHDDIPSSSSSSSSHPFNSFVTSTTMLPPRGKKMRCYGSTTSYTTGVVFALPTHFADNESNNETTEDTACVKTETWSCPSGYSAKTEFNIDGRGQLINGRQEALCPLSVLRQYNHDYLTKQEYMVGNRKVSGLNQIPFNEIFLRVGGLGRRVVVENEDDDIASIEFQRLRSFDRGVGLPVALFVRSSTYGHLICMLRARARLSAVLGHADHHHIKDIPLLYITPEDGVRVFTSELQLNMLDIASRRLNPFQNNTIAYKTTIENTTEEALQQKVEELIDLDESIRKGLSPRELAGLAGGFGATDESVATIMKQVMIFDLKANRKHEKHGRHGRRRHSTSTTTTAGMSHILHDFVIEGLAAAVRAGDYYTARQLLILYSLVASRADELYEEAAANAIDDSVSEDVSNSEIDSSSEHNSDPARQEARSPQPAKHTAANQLSGLGRGAGSLLEDLGLVKKKDNKDELSSRTPAPPLNTDHLRAATNSFGLLTVLGAAQILKAIQDGSCKRRLKESVSAVEEWVNQGEKSLAFRIASWNDQRAAQGDLHTATEQNSKFMAFVGNKAISNRKAFAGQMRHVLTGVKFTSVETLQTINEILSKMHSPCLRLELLQYVLGLDSRYSVEHCKRSVELAATCLGIDDPQ